MDFPMLSPSELNAAALDKFVRQVVDRSMISHLAQAASDVIQCDSDMMPPPAQAARPRQPSSRAIKSSDTALPTIEEFITQLVRSSNVQVGTLMSTLVYLRRLKSRLQPMAKGLRCTTHRILLAALILTAKYLNDSSPKNKHWANYSVVDAYPYNFGFSRTEVNLMEKQLLFLLDWDLRITQEDLYRELEPFLAPLRVVVQDRYVRSMQRKLEQEARERHLQEQRDARKRERDEEASMWQRALAQQQQQQQQSQEPAPTTIAYATPPSSRGSSRSRQQSSSHSRGSSRDVSPPGLLYSSGNSSYADSTSSRATTPLSEADEMDDDEIDITAAHQPYIYDGDGVCYDSPMEVVVEGDVYGRPSVPEKDAVYLRKQPTKQMLPYEISADDLRSLEETAAASRNATGGNAGKRMRGVLGRVFGTAR